MLEHSSLLLKILNSLKSASMSEERIYSREHTSNEWLDCNLPTMLSLSTCYIGLIRIYRTTFSCLLDSMPFIKTMQEPVPQLFPGMELGGFKLHSRLDLQIQILITASEDMLGRIEAAFGLTQDFTALDHGVLKSEWISMLRTMLQEEADEQPKQQEGRGECKPLKEILISLKRELGASQSSHRPSDPG